MGQSIPANGQSVPRSTTGARTIVPGIYVPIITFFQDDEEQSLDIETHKEHILYMARGGVHGFVCQGSTAEAVALTFDERAQIIRATREVLDKNGFEHVTIIAGAAGQSTKEAVSLATQAGEVGADAIISLMPSFFWNCLNAESLESYYVELADKSPLPVIIYSYPGVSAGLELTSDSIHRLAKHKNIFGIKQTDHNVGKMARIVYDNPGFFVLGGASDYLLGALAVGASGTITGLANLFPRLCVHLFDLYHKSISVSPAPKTVVEALSEARTLQGAMSSAEWPMLSGGIPSIKYACKYFLGRGGIPRRPVPESNDEVKRRIEKGLQPLADMEAKLAKGLPLF
ncbi:hypothetical protein FRC03_012339 [Tulasnella sp. 419]|nr:hypothetical protein FRC02_009344 [Tulasnella sp. 418]KAG8951916.1 hypothetical protein FRC03_012339 [Tulasnella sp. 419]